MTREFVIRYGDSEGNITERRISDITVENSRTINAYCHLRNAYRSFVMTEIQSACDANTGEVIEDVGSLYGITRRPVKQLGPREKQWSDQRRQQEYEFQQRYYCRVIYDQYRNRLFDLFGQRCFKCGQPPPLVFDHHVPIALGGMLVPGNIVALCRSCNEIKHDKPPKAFYTADELQRLQPILDQQESTLDFTLDWDAWNGDRKKYLLSLGVAAPLVDEVLFNQDHNWYVGTPTESSTQITIGWTEDDG